MAEHRAWDPGRWGKQPGGWKILSNQSCPHCLGEGLKLGPGAGSEAGRTRVPRGLGQKSKPEGQKTGMQRNTQIQPFLLTHRCHRLPHLSSSNTEQNRPTTEGKDICGLTMLSLVPPPHLRIGRLLRPARRIVAPRGSGLRARGRPGCYLDPPRPSPELSYPCGTIRDGSRAQTPTLPPTGACLSGRGSEEPSPTLPPHPAPPCPCSRPGLGPRVAPLLSAHPTACLFLTGLRR